MRACFPNPFFMMLQMTNFGPSLDARSERLLNLHALDRVGRNLDVGRVFVWLDPFALPHPRPVKAGSVPMYRREHRDPDTLADLAERRDGLIRSSVLVFAAKPARSPSASRRRRARCRF